MEAVGVAGVAASINRPDERRLGGDMDGLGQLGVSAPFPAGQGPVIAPGSGLGGGGRVPA